MKTLAAKLCDIMAECKNIPKNGRNTFQNYNYVMAADAAEYIRELMVKHGVIALPLIEDIEQTPFKTAKGADNFLVRVTVTYTLINAEDPKDTYLVKMAGTGSDTSDKAIFKAITGCQKYFIFNTFLLGGDDDPEKEEKTHSKPAERPKAQSYNTPAPQVKTTPAQTGKQPKDLNAEQLEWLRHNGKTPEQRRAAEDEISRREELSFNQGGN
jgi:hypothetical protein